MDEEQRFHRAAVEWAPGGNGASPVAAVAQALAAGVGPRAVVGVEGWMVRVGGHLQPLLNAAIPAT